MSAENNEIRVRFAPSPTGHLHVGGARTALFNWLYARKTGGTFILRIEDTDASRSTSESYEGILRGMRWLGLDWDEGPGVGGEFGPYIQSARGVLYHTDASRLIDEGKAYYCFCDPEELAAKREETRKNKGDQKYDGTCRGLSAEDVEERLAAGQPHVVRFRMPDEGEIRFRDIVRGDFSFANSDLDDFVIIKSDGHPTYNFAVVVDDARMKISHVIRGDDHISNTPRQTHLYQALGFRLPKFVHLPMILGEDRARLSKRHGATSIDFYKDRHYLPVAMVNYLALLGWSLDGKREYFERKSLIEKFSLKKVSKNPAVFDMARMEYMNAEHFKKMPLPAKTVVVYRAMEEKGLIPPEFRVDTEMPVDLKLIPGTEPVENEVDGWKKGRFDQKEFMRLALIINIFGNRLKLLKDIPGMLKYFYTDEFEKDENAFHTFLSESDSRKNMSLLADELEKLQYFDSSTIEETLRALADRLDLDAGELIHPCRVALCGQKVSPDIFNVIFLLGKNKSIERLRTVGEKV
jgi:glutamyl-tRNA synthetase